MDAPLRSQGAARRVRARPLLAGANPTAVGGYRTLPRPQRRCMSETSLQDPELLDQARATLHRYWGYPDFRAGQDQAVAHVLSGGDSLTIMPTGGGKSLCYQVPAMMLPGLTVVVSPLISLMKDQVDTLEAA